MAEQFTSISFPVTIDLAAAAMAREDDYAAHVDQLIRQLLLTDPGERVNRPEFGCGVRRLLFAPNDPAVATLAQVTIVQALTRWLGPVIDVGEVRVESLDERVEIRVAYVLRARGERRYLNLEVTL